MTASPSSLASALDGSAGKVRVVNATLAQTNARSASGEQLSEVYIRPRTMPRTPMQIAKWIVAHLDQLDQGSASGAGKLDKIAET